MVGYFSFPPSLIRENFKTAENENISATLSPRPVKIYGENTHAAAAAFFHAFDGRKFPVVVR